jgi:hypothetical protein
MVLHFATTMRFESTARGEMPESAIAGKRNNGHER